MVDNPQVNVQAKLNIKLENPTSFESISNVLEKISEQIEDGTYDAVEELSEEIADFQRNTLISNGNVRSGGLLNSITANVDGLSSTIGSNLDGYAPSVIEYGRDEVYPVNAQCLHYISDGKEYFVKSVSAYSGNPYVEPSYEYGKNIAKDVVLKNIR